MRQTYFFVVIILLSCGILRAQVTNVVFIGSVSVDGGKVYPYKLFVTDSAATLTGYSVMDVMGTDETKTAVTGSVDRGKKQIAIRETKIIYTKSKESDTDFCYLHARLKAGAIKGANTLKGHFTGYKADRKTVCAKGKIMLVCAQDVLDKLLEIAEKEKIPEPAAADTANTVPKVRIIHEKEVDDKIVTKLLPGKTLELPFEQAVVTLEIWDSKNIDGDIITLERDNVPLLERYTISGRRKTVTVDMGDSRSVNLKVICVSEGVEQVNTARIKLTAGKDVYYLDASTTMTENVTITLKRK